MSALPQDVLSKLPPCTICLEPFDLQSRIPRLIHAGHTLCTDCCQQLALSANNNTISCPLCRTTVNLHIDGFPINFLVRDMLEILMLTHSNNQQEKTPLNPNCQQCDDEEAETAASHCVQCSEFLCNLHESAHKKHKDTKSHTILSLAQLGANPTVFHPQPRCTKHQQVLKYYCVQCEEPICVECTIVAHRGHTTEEAKEAFNNMQQSVGQLIQQAKQKIDIYQQGINRVKIAQTEITEQETTIEQQINDHYDNLIHNLNSRRIVLLFELQRITRSKSNTLQSQLESLHLNTTSIISACEEVERMLQQKNDVRVLQIKKQIQQDLMNITSNAKETTVCSPQCQANLRFQDEELKTIHIKLNNN